MKAARRRTTNQQSSYPTMIHETAHKLESDGFGIVKPIKDPDGTIAYWLQKDRENFVLVTKEYAYKRLASFMEAVVTNAEKNGITLVFYEDRDETFTVFDPAYYKSAAALSRGKSKTRDSRWLELPLDEGVPLEDYLRNGTTPTTLAGSNETIEAFQ